MDEHTPRIKAAIDIAEALVRYQVEEFGNEFTTMAIFPQCAREALQMLDPEGPIVRKVQKEVRKRLSGEMRVDGHILK